MSFRQISATRFLVADDSPSQRRVVTNTLGAFGARIVREVTSGAEVLPAISQYEPDVLLLDWFMPGMDGGDVLLALGRVTSGTPTPGVIVMTCYPTQEIVRCALDRGAFALIRKPFTPRVLLDRLLGMPLPQRSNKGARVERPSSAEDLSGSAARREPPGSP